MIYEVIIITNAKDGSTHIAPFGLIGHEDLWIVAPFRTSKTLENLYFQPRCTANLTDDARVFAGCITGRRTWPLTPTRVEYPPRLSGALAHWELEVERIEEDSVRPRFLCGIQGRGVHASFSGYNRAFGAVLEASVIVSRLHLLPLEEVEIEFSRLRTIVAKTAGLREAEAFGWLETKFVEYKAAK